MTRRSAHLLGLVLLIALLTPYSLNAGRALCRGPVEGYASIAAARDQQRAVARASRDESSGNPWLSTAALAAAVATTLDLALQVKQSDWVAFSGHMVAGHALELAGCAPAATADQWRKAARHAWAPWPARMAATGLARTLGASQGDAAVAALLEGDARDQPWFAANIARTAALYPARAS